MTTKSSDAKEKLINKLKLLLLLSFTVSIYNQCGCLALNGDTSSMDNDQSSTDMMEHDPNLLIIPKNQGYGNNIPNPSDLPNDKLSVPSKQSPSRIVNIDKKSKNTKGSGDDKKSIGAQTIQAALQFGVLVGVALLVGILFMLNVGVELMCISISEKFSEKFNRHKEPDIEDLDPASLVGSFKRYK